MDVLRDVYTVENLNDSGKGSFREAVATRGYREIRFDVAGTCWTSDPVVIDNPYLNILADTSPGGFCLAGSYLRIITNGVAIQGWRARPGDSAVNDGIQVSYPAYGITIDRSSVSFAVDGGIDFNNVYDVLVQRCIIAYCLYNSIHPKTPHSMAMLSGLGANRIRIRRNLFYGNNQRNPLLSGGPGGSYQLTENNLVCISGGIGIGLNDSHGPLYADVMGNYVRQNQDDVRNFLRYYFPENEQVWTYWSGNYNENYPDYEQTEQLRLPYDQLGSGPVSRFCVDSPISGLHYGRAMSAQDAYDYVLANARARPLDTLDAAIIADVTAGGSGSLIDTPEEVGGWPEL